MEASKMNLIFKQSDELDITRGIWGVTNGQLLRIQSHLPDTRQPITIAGVHRIGRFGGFADGDPVANAHLISAAPDLYRALAQLDAYGHTDATWHLVKKALKKARGEI